MELYKPDKGIDIGGAILAALLAIVGGAIVGGIVYLVSQLIYLIFIFPFIIGAVYGFLLAYGIEFGKIRNNVVVVVIGLLGAVILYGASRYPVYMIDFKNDVRDELEAFVGPGGVVSDRDVDKVANLILEEETGSTGYWGFVQLEAKEDISIGRRSSDLFTLDGTLAWLYWVIDFGIIAAVGLMFGFTQSKEPFSTASNDWYKMDRFIGTVKVNSYHMFMKLLLDGNFEEAGEYLVDDRHAPPPKYDVFTLRTSDPLENAVLAIKEVTVARNGNLRRKSTGQYGIVSDADLRRLGVSILN